MKKLDKFYSRFGEDVKGIVQAKAKPDGDIQHMLKQLGLPVSGVIDRQHRILQDFIHTHGKELFIRGITHPGGAIGVKKLIQDFEMAKIREKREKMLAAQMTGVPLSAAGTTAVAPGMVSHAPVQQPGDTRKWIETAGYTGPDRRTRGERRSGARDRRTTLELITFKNRRFGGQRRKAQRRTNGS